MKRIVRQALNISEIPEDIQSVTRIDRDIECDPESVGMTQAGVQAIWQSVEGLYRTGTQPAIQFCLRRGGKILLNRSLGHAHGNGPHEPAVMPKLVCETDTPICYFSASKAITALLMHILTEQGQVNLLDPVSHYCPEFAQNGKRTITLHQILSHRGGIPGIPKDTPLDALWDNDRIWRLLCGAKPITVDGGTVAYHAITGGYVLQRVLEKVTGQTIQQFLDQHIRKPMGMRWFTYGIARDHLSDLATNYATGPLPKFPLSWVVKRALGADLQTVTDISNDVRFQEAVIPAGNLVGTAEEMSRFFQMMLNGGQWQGKQICEAATVRRAIQQFGSMQLDRTMMVPMRFSAGFMLGGEPLGLWGPHTERAFGHIGLINKWCWADAERDISVSLLTTGIPIVAHHLPALAKFVWTVCEHSPRLPEAAMALDVA